jgi:hypothetical protein
MPDDNIPIRQRCQKATGGHRASNRCSSIIVVKKAFTAAAAATLKMARGLRSIPFIENH